jgi:hypothetical protein
MIWMTWRQLRAQTVVAAAALALLAVAFAVTGPQLAHLYDTTVATCHARGDCPIAINAFQSDDTFLQDLIRLVMLALPALIGMFWGAPLIAASAGWRSSWAWSAWPAWPPPGCSA